MNNWKLVRLIIDKKVDLDDLPIILRIFSSQSQDNLELVLCREDDSSIF